MGKYALLIGVSTYSEGFQPLPAAQKDVAALQEVLLNPQMGGFDEVKSLVNATQLEMAEAIELWLQGRQPEDLVLLFFSGHGVKDDRRDLYFVATNTKKPQGRLLTGSAIPARFIHDCIRQCKAKYQVLILDCCFSGAFGNLLVRDDGEVPLKEQLGAEGRVVLTSTSAVDYAFEEKGADLSIYTRYLVEGIASGAADEDGDGAITVDELHHYAARKVRETSTAMSPDMITLKGEYRIRVARSPQDDPKLKYRKEAERRATAGEFTIPARRILARLRANLEISDPEAAAIEAEVLKLHRECYQRKLQEYQDTLHQCLDHEIDLSARTIDDLRDLRDDLRLKPKDVAAIERTILQGNDLDSYAATLESQGQQEKQKQEDEQKQPATPVNPPQTDQDDLSSERFGANYYAKLRDLLVAKDWKAADRETANRMCEVMDRQKKGWLQVEDFQKFPCLDLRNIERLWVKYSQGSYGFSVQKEIWQSCGSPTEYNNDWEQFGVQVGWRTKDILGRAEWLSYSQLTFDLTSPSGHLPVICYADLIWSNWRSSCIVSLLSRQDL